MKKIAIISNYAFSLVQFRTHFIRDLISKGNTVYALASDYSQDHRDHIEKNGAHPVDYYMERTGQNPLNDIRSLYSITKTLKEIEPDMTFSYGIKPVVYGLWASCIAGVKVRYAMVAGLGTLYIHKENGGFKEWVTRKLANFLYRFSLPFAEKVYFQNPDDIAFFVKKGFIENHKAVLINGSGVDLSLYQSNQIHQEPIRFTLVSRLIKEKGIYEFIEAAKIISYKWPQKNIKFVLLGDVDLNPNSIQTAELQKWVEDGIVLWPGHVDNVSEWLEKTSVFVLPTYYPEGIPRSILEAMSMSRPVITTDMPGCREAVEDGKNGFLITPKSVDELVAAMEKFIRQPTLIEKFGLASRELAKSTYDVNIVNRQIIKEMEL